MSVQPVQTLFGAQEVGQLGKTVDLEDVYGSITAVCWGDGPEGTNSAGTCELEGSHDGKNWFRLGVTAYIMPGNPSNRVQAISNGVPYTVASHLVRYARVNLIDLRPAGGQYSATVAAK